MSINYNYAYNEKSKKLTYNSSYKGTDLEESVADAIKDKLVALNVLNEKIVKYAENIGKPISRTIDIKSVSEQVQVTEVEEILESSVVSTTTLGLSNVQVYFDYQGVNRYVGEFSETDTDLIITLDSMPNTNIGDGIIISFNANRFEASIPSSLSDGTQGTFRVRKESVEIFSSVTTQKTAPVSPVVESIGAEITIGTIEVASVSNNYSSTNIENVIDDLIASANEGFTITKSFVNGTDDTDGFTLSISFSPTISNYEEIQDKDIVVKFSNNQGTIVTE